MFVHRANVGIKYQHFHIKLVYPVCISSMCTYILYAHVGTHFSYICGIIYLDVRCLVVGWWCVKCIIKCIRRIGGVLSFISFVSININGTFFNQLSLFNKFIHSFIYGCFTTYKCMFGGLK